MRNARLGEAQAGIKIAGRNINSFRYADDTTLMAESEEELLMKVKEESEKAGLKLNIHKTKMASSPVARCFFSRQPFCFHVQQKSFLCRLHFVTQNIKYRVKGKDLRKLIIFYLTNVSIH